MDDEDRRPVRFLELLRALVEATGRAKDRAVLPVLRDTLAERGGRDGE